MERLEARRTDSADETAVPAGAAPPSCPHCDRPFPESRLLTLHLGLEHWNRLDEDQRAAFESAYREERVEIRRFRLLALAAVILLYFCLLFVYAVVT